MDKSILLQKQVRDNSEDLRAYLKDLVSWEEEMKRKESEISNNNDILEAPIPRSKIKKIEKVAETKKEKPKKIKSYDYAAWDKFDVDAECEKIDAEKKDDSDNEEPSEEYKKNLRDEANYEKEKGNNFVKNKKWDEAIACYTHSIACYSKDPIYYANRALCFLKKNDLRSAEADCTSALQLEPNYVKALQRRAVAREGLKQYQESLDDLKLVLELEPHNKETKKELDRLEKRLGIAKQTPAETQKPVKEIVNITKDNKSTESATKIIKDKDKPSISAVEPNKLSEPIIKKDIKANEKPIPKQIPWPERNNSEIILPIQKLPHQRSKKPLRRIEIIESDNSDLKINTPNKIIAEADELKLNNLNLDCYDDGNSLADILAQSNKLNVDELLKDIENNSDTNENLDIKRKSNLTIPSDNKVNDKTIESKSIGDSESTFDYPVPKSSVQFYSNWKIMKNNQQHKFLYLKSIDANELPNIFRESLESDVFSDIIKVLSENFIQENLPVFVYLESLSKVKRFSALTMFMTNKDKAGLKTLLEYSENKTEASKEEINELRKKYEL